MNPLRVGVVGLGQMGAHHVRVCSELGHTCQLTAVFDIDRTVAEAVARKYCVPVASSIEDFANRRCSNSLYSNSHAFWDWPIPT